MDRLTGRSRFATAELLLVGLLLLMFSEGLLPRLFASDQSADGSPVLRLMWLPVYALILCAMVWQWRGLCRTALRMPFLIALVGLAIFSYLWSIDPGISQRRGFALAMTTCFGLFLGTRYDWRTLLRLLGIVWLIVAALSFLTALLVPSFGVMHDVHVGAWKGLYYEKNQLGGHVARAAFLCAFLFVMDRPWRVVWAGGIALMTVLVLLTTSKTSLLGLLMGFAILGLAWIMKRGVKIAIPWFWLSVLAVASVLGLLVLAPEVVFGALGRDPSLTGRTDIWAALSRAIAERPWLGYGYGVFWSEDSVPAYWVREAVEWDAPTAHNGWFEVALALGLVGLVLLILDFVWSAARAMVTSVESWTGVFALGVVCQFALFSVSESISLQQNSITWLTYVAIAARLANRPRLIAPIVPVCPDRRPRRLRAVSA